MSLGIVLVTAASVKGCEAALQFMRDAGCEVRLASTPLPIHEEWLMEHTRDVSGLVFAMEPVSRRLIENARSLKIIARPGVGYDTVDLAAATTHGVVVTVAEGTNHESVADFTLGLLLMAARGMFPAAMNVQQHGWARVTGTEVWGKTLAIVGLGRIGRAVVKRAQGFDMRVLVVSPHPDMAFAASHDIEYVSLDTALREADFLSLHAPLTPQTENLIDARAIEKMKQGAFLVNTSRGGLVNEEALAAAVRAGRLAGAAVDVLRTQGALSPSPLIGVPGILITPHMATFSRESMDRVAMSVARAVVTRLEGRVPGGLVNPLAFPGA